MGIREVWRKVKGIKSDCPCEPHDYHVSCGGDGYPSHFYTYICWNCGVEFSI